VHRFRNATLIQCRELSISFPLYTDCNFPTEILQSRGTRELQ